MHDAPPMGSDATRGTWIYMELLAGCRLGRQAPGRAWRNRSLDRGGLAADRSNAIAATVGRA